MTDKTTTHRKIGRNKGKPRLWIEGAALIEAGLEHGEGWTLVDHLTGFDIAHVRHTLKPDAKPGETVDGRRVRKIAGTPDRPIIDIAGSSLASLQLFGEMPEEVSLTFTPGAGFVQVRRSTRNAESS